MRKPLRKNNNMDTHIWTKYHHCLIKYKTKNTLVSENLLGYLNNALGITTFIAAPHHEYTTDLYTIYACMHNGNTFRVYNIIYVKLISLRVNRRVKKTKQNKKNEKTMQRIRIQ